MSRNRIPLSSRSLTACLLSAALCALLSGAAYAETCITCHTDADLLVENLAPSENKTSLLQTGNG